MKDQDSKDVAIIANSAAGPALSGGDRIFIEFAKRWARLGRKINIYVWEEGEAMCKRNNLTRVDGVKIICWRLGWLSNLGFLLTYPLRVLNGIIFALKDLSREGWVVLYSASDFWPDAIPAFIAKLRSPKVIWIAGFYLFAPSPWQKDSPYKTSFKRWLIGCVFWLTQRLAYWIVKEYADFVFVTSEPDVVKFITKRRDRSKIVVVQGGVDISESEKYLRSGRVVPIRKRKYDACFVGRFHHQKGVLELVAIWNLVCRKKRGARLALIGDGPLEREIIRRIKQHCLGENVDLLGFMDGAKKYEIFKQSKIIVHPAVYDSGGMAAAEGMAWGLPGVSFDLEALKTYYPKGIIKTEVNNVEQFAENILRLLEDKEFYDGVSRDAHNLIVETWDWEKRAKSIYERVFKYV